MSIVRIETLSGKPHIVVLVYTFLHHGKKISILKMESDPVDLHNRKTLDIETSPMIQPEPDKQRVWIEEKTRTVVHYEIHRKDLSISIENSSY